MEVGAPVVVTTHGTPTASLPKRRIAVAEDVPGVMACARWDVDSRDAVGRPGYVFVQDEA